MNILGDEIEGAKFNELTNVANNCMSRYFDLTLKSFFQKYKPPINYLLHEAGKSFCEMSFWFCKNVLKREISVTPVQFFDLALCIT